MLAAEALIGELQDYVDLCLLQIHGGRERVRIAAQVAAADAAETLRLSERRADLADAAVRQAEARYEKRSFHTREYSSLGIGG